MKSSDVFCSFIELCESRVPSLESLARGFGKGTEALGFRHFAYCSHVDPLHPPPNAVMMHSYPTAWVEHMSEEKLYAIDPVLQHAEREQGAFFWDGALPAESLSTPQRKIIADAAEFGLAHGFTVPVELNSFPDALRASCSVVPDSPTVEPLSYFAVEGMATHLCAAINRTLATSGAVTAVELSHRERQCLVLIAQGKTDAEIGKALGVARSTAHTYVERLKMRFRAGTRREAVAQALIMRHISVGDLALPRHWEPPPAPHFAWHRSRIRH